MDWRGYPALELPLRCCGDVHVARLDSGVVTVPDHDEAGEDVLTALGGGEVACRLLRAAWDRGLEVPMPSHVLRAMLLEVRDGTGPLEGTGAPHELPPRPRFPVPPSLPKELVDDLARRHHLEQVVLSLPSPWLLALLSRSLRDMDDWLRLPRDDWSGNLRSVAALASCELERTWPAHRQPPQLRCDPWAVAAATDDVVVVPPWWVSRVLARGAAVVDGTFLLDLHPHPERAGSFVARTLARTGRSLTDRSVLARLDADGWHLG